MSPLRAAVAVAIAGTATLGGLGVASSHPGDSATSDGDLAAVRRATVGYHDLEVALADGYELLDVCFEDEVDGAGMGYHYWVGPDDLDAEVDPLSPEALVYEPGRAGPKLVAVEYIVPVSLVDEPPTVLGQQMHQPRGLPFYVLHAWIWEANPRGVFADYSPNVELCD